MGDQGGSAYGGGAYHDAGNAATNAGSGGYNNSYGGAYGAGDAGGDARSSRRYGDSGFDRRGGDFDRDSFRRGDNRDDDYRRSDSRSDDQYGGGRGDFNRRDRDDRRDYDRDYGRNDRDRRDRGDRGGFRDQDDYHRDDRGGRDRDRRDDFRRDRRGGGDRDRGGYSRRETGSYREDFERTRGGEPVPLDERQSRPPPSSSVVVKGLDPDQTEDEMREAVIRICGITPHNVRVVKDRQTGEPRGFGFVDFADIKSADTLLRLCNGKMVLRGVPVFVEYSRNTGPTSTAPKGGTTFRDWICANCGIRNFENRTICFKCDAPKTEAAKEVVAEKGDRYRDKGGRDNRDRSYRDSDRFSERGDRFSDNRGDYSNDSQKPTCELLIRNLSTNTTEDTIRNYYSQFGHVRTRLVRDKATGQSRGFCFVEFPTVEQATDAMNRSRGVQFDGHTVDITYARRGHLTQQDESNRGGSNRDRGDEAAQIAQWSSGYSSYPPQQQQQQQGGYQQQPQLLQQQMQQQPGPYQPQQGVYQTPQQQQPQYSGYYGQQQTSYQQQQPMQQQQPGPYQPTTTMQQAPSTAPAYSQYGMTQQQPQQQQQQPITGYGVVNTMQQPQSQQQGYVPSQPQQQQQQPYVPTTIGTSAHIQTTTLAATTTTTTPATTTATSNVNSGYIYDPKSGYYYNPQLGYYYDPNTCYYYDSATQTYMYYDTTKQAYIPVDTKSMVPSANTTQQTTTVTAAPTVQQPQYQQQGPAVQQQPLAATTTTTAVYPTAAAVPSDYSIAGSINKQQQQQPMTRRDKQIAQDLNKWNQKARELHQEAPEQQQQQRAYGGPGSRTGPGAGSMVPSSSGPAQTRAGGGGSTTTEVVSRGFVPNPEATRILAQENIDLEKLSNFTDDVTGYRNRAAERRSLYGQPEKPPAASQGGKQNKKRKNVVDDDEGGNDNYNNNSAAYSSYTQSSIGLGYGGGNDGYVPSMGGERAGLGYGSRNLSAAAGSHFEDESLFTPQPGDSYQEIAKKKARQRYYSSQ